jgi:murein DD-endopeptidase MepM/ murein hydrolase activator NlpD
MQRFWPVPKSYSKKTPKNGENGSFKINNYYKRLKVWHTAIDIGAPTGSKVIAAESGEVVDTGVFTGPPDMSQYRRSWFVAVRIDDGRIIIYGEIRKPELRKGVHVKAGQLIGRMAAVEWAKNEPDRNDRSTLHFELYRKGTRKFVDWWHKGKKRPKDLLDPTKYLEGCEA